MKDNNTLVFTDHFTGNDVFAIIAVTTASPTNGKESQVDKQFKWMASVGAKAVAKQRESTLRPELRAIQSVNNVTHVLILDSVEPLLEATDYVNSGKYNVALLKKIRYYCESANLTALRALAVKLGGRVTIQHPIRRR